MTEGSEAALLDEMTRLVASGVAVVVARDGRIVASENGRGISPLLTLLDRQELKGALVVDKVIGKAAAAICAVGGVRRVHASLMAAGAVELLEAKGIAHSADQVVPAILNRDRSGICPMEMAVRELEDCREMVAAIRKTLAALKSATPR